MTSSMSLEPTALRAVFPITGSRLNSSEGTPSVSLEFLPRFAGLSRRVSNRPSVSPEWAVQNSATVCAMPSNTDDPKLGTLTQEDNHVDRSACALLSQPGLPSAPKQRLGTSVSSSLESGSPRRLPHDERPVIVPCRESLSVPSLTLNDAPTATLAGGGLAPHRPLFSEPNHHVSLPRGETNATLRFAKVRNVHG